GTSAGCELRLSDKTVSSIHCEIIVSRDRVRLVDAGSTNGTFVGGLRVRDASMSSGGDVRIGVSTVRLSIWSDSTYVQLSMRDRLGELVGSSAAMRRVYAMIERAAPTDSVVLLQGETGTGKELVAQTIRESSRRASGPFVAIDCGSIPEALIESELF